MRACAQATLSLSRRPTPPSTSNMTRGDYMRAVAQVKEYIQAGDIFQLVLSHRFKRRTFADPFEIYRRGPAPVTLGQTAQLPNVPCGSHSDATEAAASPTRTARENSERGTCIRTTTPQGSRVLALKYDSKGIRTGTCWKLSRMRWLQGSAGGQPIALHDLPAGAGQYPGGFFT